MHKILHFEGLRGFAALMVLFCHFNLFFKPDLYNTNVQFTISGFPVFITNKFFGFITDGELAVYIFWTMSAYVISIKLFKSHKKIGLIFPIIKRYIRLVIPVFGSVLIGYFCMNYNLLQNHNKIFSSNNVHENTWLFSMYSFIQSVPDMLNQGLWEVLVNYNRDHTYNAVLWSMEKEWWGSLFCFISIFLFKNLKVRRIIYILLFFSLLLSGFSYLSCFIAGLYISDLEYNKNKVLISDKFNLHIFNNLTRNIFSFTVLFLIIIVGGYPNFYGWFNVVISVLTVFIIHNSKLLNGFFSNTFLCHIGNISFSIYLIHIPVICTLSSFLLIEKFPIWQNILYSLITIYILSIIFNNIFDKPAIKFGNNIIKQI